jgi:hypothetical protein
MMIANYVIFVSHSMPRRTSLIRRAYRRNVVVDEDVGAAINEELTIADAEVNERGRQIVDG